MSLGTTNRDGGKTSESGHLRAIYKGYAGEVLSGLAVSQRGAGANMSVDIAIGDAVIPRSDGTYGHPSFNDAVLNKTITTADPSNPRRDIVIMYIDYTVTPSTGVSNNTNGVVLTKVVAGTPAGSPSDPSDASLQSAAGASNPYIKLARVRVGAGVTSVANSVIDDLRTFAHAVTNGGWKSQSAAWDFWTYSAYDSTYKIATITVPDSTIFTVGQKVRYWQLTGGWKYGFIVEKTNATTIKVYQGHTGGYTLNNERIYLPAFSREEAPDGFDRSESIWSTRVTDTTLRGQASPTVNTWYNIGTTNSQLAVGLGLWRVTGKVAMQNNASGNRYAVTRACISNANNTNPYPLLGNDNGEYQTSGNDTGCGFYFEDTIALAANSTLYMNGLTTGASTNLYFLNSGGLVIKAVCAYLYL